MTNRWLALLTLLLLVGCGEAESRASHPTDKQLEQPAWRYEADSEMAELQAMFDPLPGRASRAWKRHSDSMTRIGNRTPQDQLHAWGEVSRNLRLYQTAIREADRSFRILAGLTSGAAGFLERKPLSPEVVVQQKAALRGHLQDASAALDRAEADLSKIP